MRPARASLLRPRLARRSAGWKTVQQRPDGIYLRPSRATALRRVAGYVFTSVADLARTLRRYIRAYEKQARPFRWAYTNPQRRIHTNSITGTAHRCNDRVDT